MSKRTVSWDADGGELYLSKSEVSEGLWEALVNHANGRRLRVWCVDDTRHKDAERACGLLSDIAGTCSGCATLFRHLNENAKHKDDIYTALAFIETTCARLRLIADDISRSSADETSE